MPARILQLMPRIEWWIICIRNRDMIKRPLNRDTSGNGSPLTFISMGDGATSLIIAILPDLVFVALFAIPFNMG